MASFQKMVSEKTGRISYRVVISQPKGKPITKHFKTKTLAREFARNIESEKELQRALTDVSLKSLTLGQLIDEFLAQSDKRDKPAKYLLRWWKSEYGDWKINDFNQAAVRAGLKQLIRVRGVQPQTTNRYKANLSSVFEFGKEEYGLEKNPCRGIRAKPESKGRTRFLTDRDQERLLQECREFDGWDRLYLLVLMAITTGARRGELLKLVWPDLCFKTQVATLHQTKNGTARILPLTGAVIKELRKFRSPAGLIFPSENNPKKPYYFRYCYNQAVEQAGLVDFHFHDLRHTAASNLARSGATLLEIANVLGHSSTAVTMRYSHLCIEHKRKLINDVMGHIGATGV